MIKANIKKVFSCDIEQIWKIVTDLSDVSWRSDLSSIEVVDETHFIEYSKDHFPTHFTILSKQSLKEYSLYIENANMKGRWIGFFRELENGNVELDFTEEIEPNHFFMKLLARFYLKQMQKQYMKDLERRLNLGTLSST